MILLENSSIVWSLEASWLQFGSLSLGLLWQFWVFCCFIKISVLLAIVLWKMSEVSFRDHIKLFIAFCSMDIFREGSGNPLKCSCLENPRDWGAWWAAVYGVAQSRTQLKRLSSSSSSTMDILAVLLLIIQEHGISFHFFESFSIRNIIFTV